MGHRSEIHIVGIIHPNFEVNGKVIADIDTLDIDGIYHDDQTCREGGYSKSLALYRDIGYSP